MVHPFKRFWAIAKWFLCFGLCRNRGSPILFPHGHLCRFLWSFSRSHLVHCLHGYRKGGWVCPSNQRISGKCKPPWAYRPSSWEIPVLFPVPWSAEIWQNVICGILPLPLKSCYCVQRIENIWFVTARGHLLLKSIFIITTQVPKWGTEVSLLCVFPVNERMPCKSTTYRAFPCFRLYSLGGLPAKVSIAAGALLR